MSLFKPAAPQLQQVDDHNPCWNARDPPSGQGLSPFPRRFGPSQVPSFSLFLVPFLDHNNPPFNPSSSLFFSCRSSSHLLFYRPFAYLNNRPTTLLIGRAFRFRVFRGSEHILGAVPTSNSSPTPAPFLFLFPSLSLQTERRTQRRFSTWMRRPHLIRVSKYLSSSCSFSPEGRAHINMAPQRAIPHYSELVEYNYAVAGQ